MHGGLTHADKVEILAATSEVQRQLSAIGNNINQIARNVNIHDGTTMQQMVETRKLLRQIQQVITDAAGRGE